mmetsp:Transcript_36797/g.59093  ORF Transcript_36797/g.59093 Transcript_36797/m.59093 type:complete len:202 (-) Transcript_36797:1410-2015(-)
MWVSMCLSSAAPTSGSMALTTCASSAGSKYPLPSLSAAVNTFSAVDASEVRCARRRSANSPHAVDAVPAAASPPPLPPLPSFPPAAPSCSARTAPCTARLVFSASSNSFAVSRPSPSVSTMTIKCRSSLGVTSGNSSWTSVANMPPSILPSVEEQWVRYRSLACLRRFLRWSRRSAKMLRSLGVDPRPAMAACRVSLPPPP